MVLVSDYYKLECEIVTLKVKAQAYDDLMAANSIVVKNNLTLTGLQQELTKVYDHLSDVHYCNCE